MNTVRINGQDYTSSLSDAEIAFMGNLSLPTTAQTLSGAIAEHENDISELNSKIVGTYLGKGTYTNKLVMGSYGFVSGSNKNLYLYVPMNISDDVTTISATSVLIGLRAGNGGYIGGADNTNITNMIIGIGIDKTSGYISITATHPTSWHATNNVACVGTARLTFTLS